jgi:polyisoprenoid-binding protein YceI
MADSAEQGSHEWTVDPSHSSIDFSVRHMGIFTVRGSLGKLNGTGKTEGAKLVSATLSIDATAIDTNNADRDAHIKTAEFLNVEAFPSITFVSTSLASSSDSEYTIVGDLTIAGKTHSVTVEAEAVLPITDPWGAVRAGVTGKGVLKRSDWGMTWNSVMETGHVMISDEIKFTFDVQATVPKS